MTVAQNEIDTSHCRIAWRETGGDGLPVLMIHGNSSSGAVFRNQLDGRLGRRFRLIAPDLPGHGDSADAIDPERTYNMVGYAETMTELLGLLGIGRAVVFGWSLGGHIGLEMIGRYPGLMGVMITGSPPAAPAQMGEAFLPSPHMGLAGQEIFSAGDVENYARATAGEPFEPFMRDNVARTDGRARRLMVEKLFTGQGRDQDAIVAGPTPPIAVLNGRDEPFVNVGFVERTVFSNLWEGKKHLIDNSGHAPFWDSPDRFDPVLERFVDDMAARR